MKTKCARLSMFGGELILVFLLAGGLLAQQAPTAGSAQGQAVPHLVKFSGTVKDADGKPRTGVTGITFALYKDPAGGAALWLETQNVTIDAQGRYMVLLGSNSAEGVPLELFSANEAQWLGVQSEGLPEQRALLGSVPYALKAADAETLGGSPAVSLVLAAPPTAGDSSSMFSASGGFQITTPGKGIIVGSPKCAQIGIDNTGSGATVVVPCPLAITTTSLPNATAGTAYDQPIQTSGGKGTAITFALANSTTLPAWASLNTSSGHLTGTPAAGDVGTSAPFQISATQNGYTVTSENLTILTMVASICTGAPTGHESMLNGQYAFVVQGFEGGGNGTPVAIAASFHANGAARLTGGDFDINKTAGATHATINRGSYTVGLDPTSSGDLGCVSFSLSNGSTTGFTFSLGGLSSRVFSKGRIIEYDDATGTGSRGSGVLLRQDRTSFLLSNLQPRYAFGVDGVDSSGGRHFASAGSFTVDTSGNISSGFADTNYAGASPGETTGGTGKIDAISTTTGRATMTLTLGGQTTHQAIYMVNADEVFMIGTDPLSSVPIYSGRAIVTASSFTQSSLSGNYVIHTTGIEPPGDFIPCADVLLVLVNLDSTSGTYSGTSYYYELSAGVFVPSPVSGATYVVDATSGRTTLSGLGWVVGHDVFYIATPTATTEPISAFFVATSDYRANFGFAEFQPSQTYSTSGMAGNYFAGTEDPGDNTVSNEIDVVNVSSGETVTGSGYASGDGGLGTTSPSGAISIGSNGVGGWQYQYGGCPLGYWAITNGTRLFTIPVGGGYCNGVPVLRPAVVTVYERQKAGFSP